MSDKKSILLIDDDSDDCKLIQESFQIAGFEGPFECVEDSETVMSHLLPGKQGQLPACIILDVNMPKIDGKEMLVQLKSHPELKQIPVIMYSTGFRQTNGHDYVKYGAAWCQTKGSHLKEYIDFAKKVIQFIR